jgi:hypothetical protein
VTIDAQAGANAGGGHRRVLNGSQAARIDRRRARELAALGGPMRDDVAMTAGDDLQPSSGGERMPMFKLSKADSQKIMAAINRTVEPASTDGFHEPKLTKQRKSSA